MTLTFLPRLAASAAVVALLLSGCTYRNAEAELPAPSPPGGPNSPPACDTTAVSYSRTLEPLLAQSCVGCHNAARPAADLNLQSFAQVQASARNGDLVGVIGHLPGYSPMPKNGPQLSACELTKLKKWVREGALNN